MNTRRQTLDRLARPLVPLYGEREARSIARLVLSELTGIGIPALIADPSAPLEAEGLDEIAARLAAGEPVQYVLGRTEFCGRSFSVRKGVLIPRPETEELVLWIVREEGARLRERGPKNLDGGPFSLLDVGTGSGCIAASLKLALPEAALYAADISDKALAVAAENCRALGADVALRRADALADLAERFPEPFDAIVSNPPYVPQGERGAMRPNVRDYEPAEALFVPDDDPLRFYRAIARASRRMLRPGGRLYFEIHERFAEEMLRMLDEEGYAHTRLREDMNAKPRMTCSRTE